MGSVSRRGASRPVQSPGRRTPSRPVNRSAATGWMRGSRRIGGVVRSPGPSADGAGRSGKGLQQSTERVADRRQRRVEAQEPMAARGIVLAVDAGPARGTDRAEEHAGVGTGVPRRSRRSDDRSDAPAPGRRPGSRPRGAGHRRSPKDRAETSRPVLVHRTTIRSFGPSRPSSDPSGFRSIRPRVTGMPWGMSSPGRIDDQDGRRGGVDGQAQHLGARFLAPGGGPSAEAQQVIPGRREDDGAMSPPGSTAIGIGSPPSVAEMSREADTGIRHTKGPVPRAASSISVSTRMSCSPSARRGGRRHAMTGRPRRSASVARRIRRRKSSRPQDDPIRGSGGIVCPFVREQRHDRRLGDRRRRTEASPTPPQGRATRVGGARARTRIKRALGPDGRRRQARATAASSGPARR